MEPASRPIQLVGALIRRDGRLLVVRRALECRILPGYWDIPGGHVEPGGSLVEALHREVREETGLSVRILAPARTIRYELPPEGEAEEHDFLCEIDGADWIVLDPKEHTTFDWLAADGLERAPSTPEMRAMWRWALGAVGRSRA